MQTHLKGFGLENFRVFKDYTWFDFAPITILTGPNSSGKSSLNKALLLLKDNFEKGNLPPSFSPILNANSENIDFELSADGTLDISKLDGRTIVKDLENDQSYIETLEPSSIEFNSYIHNLNDASQAINHRSNSISFIFDISYDILTKRLLTPKDWKILLENISYEGPNFFENKNITNIEKSFNKNELLKKLAEKMKLETNLNKIVNKTFYPTSLIYRLRYELIDSIAKTVQKIEIRDLEGKIILQVNDKILYFDICLLEKIVNDDDFILSSFFRKNIEKYTAYPTGNGLQDWIEENSIIPDMNEHIYEKIISKLGIIYKKEELRVDIIGQKFSRINYLAPSYNRQKRSYSEDDSSEFKKTMSELYRYQSKGFTFDKYFSDSLSLFNIEGNLSIQYNVEQDIFFPNIDGSSLVNFGYGYYRLIELIFTIAVHGAKKYFKTDSGGYVYDEKSSMIILEEPEANLHPKYQSMLADLIIDAANTFDIQFIIETHSEYLIRKIQYLTATKTIKPRDSIIYYFHQSENITLGEKQVKKIEILEDGSLTDDFGAGFFDEAANWELELLRLKNIKNRQN